MHPDTSQPLRSAVILNALWAVKMRALTSRSLLYENQYLAGWASVSGPEILTFHSLHCCPFFTLFAALVDTVFAAKGLRIDILFLCCCERNSQEGNNLVKFHSIKWQENSRSDFDSCLARLHPGTSPWHSCSYLTLDRMPFLSAVLLPL